MFIPSTSKAVKKRKFVGSLSVALVLITLWSLSAARPVHADVTVWVQYNVLGSQGSVTVGGTLHQGGSSFQISVQVSPSINLNLLTEYRIGTFESILFAVGVSDITRNLAASAEFTSRTSWQGGTIDHTFYLDSNGNFLTSSYVELAISLGNIGAVDYSKQQSSYEIPGKISSPPIGGSINFGDPPLGGTLWGSIEGTLFSSGQLQALLKMYSSISGNVNAADPSRVDASGTVSSGTSVGGVVVPIDKFGLLAPYVGLALTIIVATVASVIYVERVKHRKEKQ